VLQPGEPAITELTCPPRRNRVFGGSIVGMETYPPAPWWSTGTMWIASLPTEGPLPTPDGLTAIGGNRLGLAVVRYRGGTLSYNEVFVGSVVRRGARVGLGVHAIWVDSPESLWGGRRIWGLPKQPATFTWRDRGLTMAAQDGRLEVRFEGSPKWSARVPFVAPAFGMLGHRMQFFHGIGHGRLRVVRIEILAWPANLPRLRESNVPALWLNDFHMVVREPRQLSFVEPDVHN
jgi:hypothetical protein